jgi:hypothetical protein
MDEYYYIAPSNYPNLSAMNSLVSGGTGNLRHSVDGSKVLMGRINENDGSTYFLGLPRYNHAQASILMQTPEWTPVFNF